MVSPVTIKAGGALKQKIRALFFLNDTKKQEKKLLDVLIQG